ncbi:phosphate/phosphite/phosphonate ABC transporter substrate-binding protein [Salinibius halmophilus]|uniref:phosphate/phosphite/phosphonate ABC transporter substrate-binding protein n=1 Tax=Salinibius halmophilus TaxID=1853216 RepID=UPI000E67536E|nr:phosphate/phosphite/phosphonate ABC transporter substrate-binding protein [Salinibius halmophilus]
MRAIFLVLLTSLSMADTFTFGIVPQQSAQVLAEKWTPIFKYLSEQTGDTYQFKTAADIPAFERELIEGAYDFAYMNPYHYTVFSQHPGYRAFAKQANKSIRGIVVVANNSPAQSLADLANQTLAFPSPAAFAATVIPQAVLRQQQIEFTPQYVSSHDSVYLTVGRGLFAGGGGIERTLSTMDDAAQNKLRVLWRSPAYTPHAFAAHPAVDTAAVERLAAAFAQMHETQRGKALLSEISFESVEQAHDQQWNDIRALGINLLDDLLTEYALDD